MARPEFWNHSFQVTRMLGIIDFGGSDFTEIHEVIQRITIGDDESWYREWSRMGELCEAQADEAERVGNRFTARFGYQRASSYYRASQFYMPGSDARKIPTLARLRDVFQKAMRHFDHPIEVVHVPYEGTTLQGYFVPSRVGAGRRPTILYLNGADSLSEEAYFTVALPASMAGYHCLVYNAPRCRHHALRARLAHAPGLRALRHADGRLPVPYRSRDWFGPKGPAPHIIKLIGAKDPEEFFELRERYTLKGVLGRITCPILYLIGAEDWAPQSISQGVHCLEETGSAIKRLRVVERAQGLGGVTHCNKDNLHVMHAHTFNFLNEVLDYRPGASR